MQLEESITMSSGMFFSSNWLTVFPSNNTPIDWIAHGLIDSIVDSFSLLINTIEKEVDAVDSMVLGLGDELQGVEEVDDDLSVLTPVRSKDNCFVFNLEYTVIDDDDLDVAHMMGGLIKTLLSKIQKLFYAQFKRSPFTTISTTFLAISS